MAMLAEKMRRQFAIVNNSHDTPAFVDEMFAIADSDPELHKSETKCRCKSICGGILYIDSRVSNPLVKPAK